MYIKLDNNRDLTITVNEPIYRGDNLNQKITYLIPKFVGDIDMAEALVYLSFIRADGTADIAWLERQEDAYNDGYYKYFLPITCTLSRYAGEICTWLQIYSGSGNHPMVAKSGECILRVLASLNMDEYIDDRHLTMLYQIHKRTEDRIAAMSEELDEVRSLKADNIVFDEENSTIQLVSTSMVMNEETGEEEVVQTPLGDPIYVRADNKTATIVAAEINEDGDLVFTFDDETTANVGHVTGKDGEVYVPHIDARKILTFTVETEPKEPPEPVDLNPNDEWGGIDESEVTTDYVWESMSNTPMQDLPISGDPTWDNVGD